MKEKEKNELIEHARDLLGNRNLAAEVYGYHNFDTDEMESFDLQVYVLGDEVVVDDYVVETVLTAAEDLEHYVLYTDDSVYYDTFDETYTAIHRLKFT